MARLSFGDLDLKARSIAAQLQQHFEPGDKVLLAYTSHLEFVGAFFGCLYAGVVAVPVAAPSGSTDLARLAALARDTGAAGLCTGREGFNLEHLLMSAPGLQRRLRCVDTSDDTGRLADRWIEPAVTTASPALLQYTAGTAGEPKGVLLSHGNLLHNQRLIQQSFGHSSQTVGVSWLPLHRDMGLVGHLLQPLYVGCTSVLMSPAAFLARPLRWLQAISKYRGTTSGGPAFAYELCLRRLGADQLMDLDLGSWKTAFVGAGPVPPQTLARFAEKFSICHFRADAFRACYGLTEATLFVSGTAHRQAPNTLRLDADALQLHRVQPAGEATQRVREIVSSGKSPGLDLLIVDPATRRPCPADRVGEIWLRGGSVAQGYCNVPAPSQAAFGATLADTDTDIDTDTDTGANIPTGPFLRTGDLGFVCGGELYVTGTLDEVVEIEGRHYYLQDIEESVRASHPALHAGAAAAIYVHSAKPGQRLVVLQEVKHDELQRLPRAQILKAARNTLLERVGARLQDIVFLRHGSLPRTASGRINRELAWAACVRAGHGGGGAAPIRAR
ncbi:fatty acyl-AMP ligase [Azohydromonas aeria]|uniref:fatty acyl-AMP ligase n=1 Tax=Azohydromonas aeria TaxID=2590212 RepID=UPI001E3354E1|nr:fatty acyl-AMP ligase [Azohydromonas aeria]